MAAVLFWICVLLVGYTYAGYPLLVGLLAGLKAGQKACLKAFGFSKRKRQASEPQEPFTPTVTLLIAAYNEEAVLAQKLENSLELEYPAACLQILVAADGSNDGTVATAQEYADRGVETVYAPERRGKMAAINHAMAAARGEIVVFSDANNLYDPAALRELVRPFAGPRVGGVSGAKVIQKGDGALGESEGAYWKYESWVKRQETRLGSTTGVAGEIFAIRRALFEPAPESIINDDFYLALRLIRRGWRVVYAPRAISRERVSATAQDEMTRRARIVAGRYQAMGLSARLLPWKRPLVVWQVISHKFLRPLVPLAMIGALLANLWAAFFPPASGGFWRLGKPFGWGMLALQGLFYLSAWAGARLKIPGLAGRLLYLPAFLVNSNLAALIGLVRYVRGNQTALWERVRRR